MYTVKYGGRMKLIVKKKDYTKGEIIKILREWTGKTQKEFARDLKKSESIIQKYEADEVNYGIETLLDIAKENNILITFEKK